MTETRRRPRILRWLGIVALTFVVIAAAGTWWAHRHLTRLIIASFDRTYPGLALSAKTVALSWSGELNLKSVRITVRRDGSEVLNVPSAKVGFSWRGLRGHFIREIQIEKPRVKITDDLLTALPPGSPRKSDDAPWRIGRLLVRDGAVRLDLAALPSARFQFSVDLEEKSRATNRIALSAVSVRTRPADAVALEIPLVEVRASAEDLAARKIRDVLVNAPRVVVTDQLLKSLPAGTGETQSGPAWSVDRVAIEHGSVSVDLAKFPRLDFAFAGALQEKQLIGGTPVALDVTSVRVRAREDDEDALTIPSIKARATLEGLQAGRLREISVDQPRVLITDEFLAAFTTGEAQPGPQPPPAEPAWKLERLAINGGLARVDLAGAPLAEFGFAAQVGDGILAPREPGETQAALDVSDLALRVRGASADPFLRVPAVRAKLRLPELLREHRIASVEIDGLDFHYNKIFRDMIAAGEKPDVPAPKPAPANAVAAKPARPYGIGQLTFADGRIHLDDLGVGVPAITARINTSIRNIAFAPDAGAGGQELQTIELSQIALTSPLDPFFEVLKLDSIFIRFTLAGVWQRQIEEIAIIHPLLYIGPDLFWYIDRVQKNEDAPPADAPADTGPPWVIQRFSAKSGQLVLALEGRKNLALPMPFESNAEGLNFRKLADLRLKLRIDMPRQDYNYPGYQLAMRDVSGRLEFSLPPDNGANNVVNTLRLGEIRWKDFRGRNLFLDVTYDAHGIYGNLGGHGYTGFLRGQFNFHLDQRSPWDGWIAGTHIDLKQITDVIVPEKFSLTGPADFRLTVAAHASEFDSVVGDFSAKQPGQLRIGKIDDIIKELPGDWGGVKRGLSRISLETLRDFAYDTAHGDFRFRGRTGTLHLDLRGPLGSRKVEVVVHDDAAPRTGRRVAARQP
jgi:hypothetical protein